VWVAQNHGLDCGLSPNAVDSTLSSSMLVVHSALVKMKEKEIKPSKLPEFVGND